MMLLFAVAEPLQQGTVLLACLVVPFPACPPLPWPSVQMMPELGFGPEDNDRLVASYSGGWQMRMCLGKILLKVGAKVQAGATWRKDRREDGSSRAEVAGAIPQLG